MNKKNRRRHGKIDTNVSAMIDVVFQLLIFFMLTLKIVEPEGDFSVNMPADGKSPDVPPATLTLKVRLTASADGTLANLSLNSRSLGNDALVFERLNREILSIIGRPDDPAIDDLEVEIDADYHLHFRNVINAIGACRGRKDEATGRITQYIRHIRLKPLKNGVAATNAGWRTQNPGPGDAVRRSIIR